MPPTHTPAWHRDDTVLFGSWGLSRPTPSRAAVVTASSSADFWAALREEPGGRMVEASGRPITRRIIRPGDPAEPVRIDILTAIDAVSFDEALHPRACELLLARFVGWWRHGVAVASRGRWCGPARTARPGRHPVRSERRTRDCCSHSCAEFVLIEGMGHELPPGLWQPIADHIAAVVRHGNA